MRRMTGLLLAVMLAITGVAGAVAQADDSALGTGEGSTAILTDDRGNQVASMEVSEIEAGWSDYGERGAPARGYDFYAVHFSITVIGDDPVEVNNSRFSLVDSQGLNNSRAFVRLAETSTTEVLEDTVDLDSGETLETTLVFELFSDVTPVLFMWQPSSGSLVMIDVSDGGGEGIALAHGLETPAVYGDDRGNPVASIEVLEVEDDWQEFDQYSSPDRGMRHVAVHFRITNLSNDSIELNPYNVSLLDSESTNNSRSSTRAAETATVAITSDTTTVAPGETLDGMLVYTLYEGVDPAALIWQPEYGVITAVILTDNGDADTGAVPAGLPGDDEEDDAQATPAA